MLRLKNSYIVPVLVVLALLIAANKVRAVCMVGGDAPTTPTDERFARATTADEARSRALLLYEMANGTLQVMHRDFFDADEAHAIPSASLEDVFGELEKSFGVQIKWLTVNTDVVNFDHQAKTEFEKSAVSALASGKPYAESSAPDRYQFAGSIRLGSQCLKCHVKLRSGNEDRTAGIVISMPIKISK